MLNTLIQLHKTLFLWMHGFTLNNPELHSVIYFIAEKMDHYVIALSGITLFYFVYQSTRHRSWKRFNFLAKEGLRLVVAVCTAWGVSYAIKHITKLPRPYLRFPDEVIRLFDYGGFDSFPSGHATLFMALAVMISLHHRHVGFIFIFLALLISLARVSAGIHFPIDILVGWVIGGFLSFFIYKKLHL